MTSPHLHDIRIKIYEEATRLRSLINCIPMTPVDKMALNYYYALLIGRRHNMRDHHIARHSLKNAGVVETFNTFQDKSNSLITMIEDNYKQNHHNRYALRGLVMGLLLTDREFAYADVIEIFPPPDLYTDDAKEWNDSHLEVDG